MLPSISRTGYDKAKNQCSVTKSPNQRILWPEKIQSILSGEFIIVRQLKFLLWSSTSETEMEKLIIAAILLRTTCHASWKYKIPTSISISLFLTSLFSISLFSSSLSAWLVDQMRSLIVVNLWSVSCFFALSPSPCIYLATVSTHKSLSDCKHFSYK